MISKASSTAQSKTLSPLVKHHLLIDGTPLRQNSKGVGRYTYHLCRELDEQLDPTWRMTIITFDWELPSFPCTFRGEFVRIPYKSDLRLGLSYYPRLIKQLKPNVFIRPRESIGLNYGISTITVCHDLNELIWQFQPPRSWYRQIFDTVCQQLRIYALHNSDFVICNSEFVQSEIVKRYCIPLRKTRIGYCGVDPRFYELAPRVNVRRVQQRYGGQGFLLAFATGDHRENFTILPSLFESLKHKGYSGSLVIAGVKEEANYASNLFTEFTRRKLYCNQDYFIEPFLGEDRFNDLVELYTAADFYLELSLHEGFGMQLVEAMACGTTCISSSRAALADVGSKWVVSIVPDDAEQITESVMHALNGNLHVRNNDQQIVYTQRFSWRKVGKQLSDLLTTLSFG